MLNHSFAHDTDIGQCASNMILKGALLPIEIAPPQPLVDELLKKKKPIPDTKTGIALIDTGAQLTSIHEPFLSSLGVKAVGVQNMTTPSGGSNQVNSYPVRLKIPAHNIDVDLPEIITANLENFKTPDGEQIIALIGRDFLSNCVFIYNGHLGMYTLASWHEQKTLQTPH